MATIPLTESDLQDAIHTLYENDPDTPASTDDDYLIRRRLMNAMVNRWENNMGTLWNELWTNTSVSSTGATLTIATADSTYAAPTSFLFPGGFVKVLNADGTVADTYPVVKVDQVQSMAASDKYCYFRGDTNSGYTLVMNPAPGPELNGLTLNYDYYKRATAFTGTTVTPEMSDPYYIVHGVVAELHKADNNLALYDSSLAEAEDRLKQMVMKNAMFTHYQDFGMEDQQFVNNGATFGS